MTDIEDNGTELFSAELDAPTELTEESLSEPRLHVTAEDEFFNLHSDILLKTNELQEDENDINNEQLNSSKPSRELKSLLALSKEAKLDTNISHKRKSIDFVRLAKGEGSFPKSLPVESSLIVEQQNVVPKKSRISTEKIGKYPVTAESELEETATVEEPNSGGAAIEEKKINDKAICNLKMDEDIPSFKVDKDKFCWRCHRSGVNISCETCPRSYHQRCLKQTITDTEHWPCPECVAILRAENTQTRSPAMKGMTLEHLCGLLKFGVKRMIDCNGSEPFMHPVSDKEFPHYRKYITQPMDLTLLNKNIKANLYGSTQAFEADAKWILHNSIIFNTFQSKLTNNAKTIIKICKQEMAEIENCSSCYLNANTKKATWFIEVCPKPHILVWAKLKGFPFWPAKAMCCNSSGMVDVRFFGAHDRAWVSYKDCYLYSRKDPNSNKQKRNDILECIKEVDIYISNLKAIYGEFNYAPFKIQYEPEIETKQMQLFLPRYRPNMPPRKIRELPKPQLAARTSTTSTEIEDGIKEDPADDSALHELNEISDIKTDGDDESMMEGYGTEEDDTPSIADGESRSREIRKLSNATDEEDNDGDEEVAEDESKIEAEADDDTQVAGDAVVETSGDRTELKVTRGVSPVLGVSAQSKLKPDQISVVSTNVVKRHLSEEFLKDAPSKLPRRNSDQSVKSDSSRLSTISDKINRVDISENVEITLRNDNAGLNISENVSSNASESSSRSGYSSSTETESKRKPVQVDVENSELSISPRNKVKITDKLMKKISDPEEMRAVDAAKRRISSETTKSETDILLEQYKNLIREKNNQFKEAVTVAAVVDDAETEELVKSSTSKVDERIPDSATNLDEKEVETNNANENSELIINTDDMHSVMNKEISSNQEIPESSMVIPNFEIFVNVVKEGVTENCVTKDVIAADDELSREDKDDEEALNIDAKKDTIKTKEKITDYFKKTQKLDDDNSNSSFDGAKASKDLKNDATLSSSKLKSKDHKDTKINMEESEAGYLSYDSESDENLAVKKIKLDENKRAKRPQVQEKAKEKILEKIFAEKSVEKNTDESEPELKRPKILERKRFVGPKSVKKLMEENEAKKIRATSSEEQIEDGRATPLDETQIDEANIRSIIHSSLNDSGTKQIDSVKKTEIPKETKKRKQTLDCRVTDENDISYVKIVPIQSILNKSINDEVGDDRTHPRHKRPKRSVANVGSPILLNKLSKAEAVVAKEIVKSVALSKPLSEESVKSVEALDLVCVELKSEPESEEEEEEFEEEQDEYEYMEKKRKYLSALNISEKQEDDGSQKPKKSVIRTRSKTEEKNKFKVTDNLSRIIDDVASHYSSAKSPTSVLAKSRFRDRRKSSTPVDDLNSTRNRHRPPNTSGAGMTQEMGEIFVKSFARVQSSAATLANHKPKPRKSYPGSNLRVFTSNVKQVSKAAIEPASASASLNTTTNTTPAVSVATPTARVVATTVTTMSMPPSLTSRPIETVTANGQQQQHQGYVILAQQPTGSSSLTLLPTNHQLASSFTLVPNQPTLTSSSSHVLNTIVGQNSLNSISSKKLPLVNVSRSQNYIPQQPLGNAANCRTTPTLAEMLNDVPNLVPISTHTDGVTELPPVPTLSAAVTPYTNDSISTVRPVVAAAVDSTQPNGGAQSIEDEFGILTNFLPDNVSRAMSELLCRAPPKLKPRPPGALSQVYDSGVPSTAGPLSTRINAMSHRLGDYFRGMLIETLEDLGKGNNPEAIVTSLKLQLEQARFKHDAEVLEIRKNVCTIFKDIQQCLIDEKERITDEVRSACELETIRRVEEAKSKQWCANCSKEAQFYCCWNTSYCDYPCQQKHWVKHMNKCSQHNNSGPSQQQQSSHNLTTAIRPHGVLLRPTTAPKGFQRMIAKPTKVYLNRSGNPKAINTFKTSVGSHLTLVEPGNLEFLNTSLANKLSKSVLSKNKTANTTATSPSSSASVVLTQKATSTSNGQAIRSNGNADNVHSISDDEYMD